MFLINMTPEDKQIAVAYREAFLKDKTEIVDGEIIEEELHYTNSKAASRILQLKLNEEDLQKITETIYYLEINDKLFVEKTKEDLMQKFDNLESLSVLVKEIPFTYFKIKYKVTEFRFRSNL